MLLACRISRAAVPKFDDHQPRAVSRSFVLKEWLEHDYADELVSYPITFASRGMPVSTRFAW